MTDLSHPVGLDLHLGFEFLDATADRVVIAWDVADIHRQPAGLIHGGVYCAVVESAASYGAALWWGDRGQVVGVHNATDFLRAASGRMTATATPLHRGRSQQLWLVEVSDADGRIAARGQVRLQNLSRS